MVIITFILEKTIGLIYNLSEDEIKEALKDKRKKRSVLLFLSLILILILVIVSSFFIIRGKDKIIEKQANENKILTNTVVRMNEQLMRINSKLNEDLKDKNIEVNHLHTEKTELQKEISETRSSSSKEIERIKSDAKLSNYQKSKLIEQVTENSDKKIKELLDKLQIIENDKLKLLVEIKNISNERDSLKIISLQKDEIIARIETKPINCYFSLEKRLDGINKSDGTPDKGISTELTDVARRIIELSISFELSRSRENNDYFTVNIINNGLNISKEVSTIAIGEDKGNLIINFRKKSLTKGTLKVEFCNMGKVITTKTYTLK